MGRNHTWGDFYNDTFVERKARYDKIYVCLCMCKLSCCSLVEHNIHNEGGQRTLIKLVCETQKKKKRNKLKSK